MRTLLLNREDCYRGPLILVNRKYALHGAAQPEAPGALSICGGGPERDAGPVKAPGDLRMCTASLKGEAGAPVLAVADKSYPEILLESEAATALCRGLCELLAWGRIVPVSGYRSRREQERIYRDSLEENGPEFTGKYVALPDRSEHQTGYAIDLGEGGRELDFIRPSFPEEGICGRFRREAARFGFILRYPAGREAVTGIAHEPWHFRYVGCPHARIMEQEGLVLEEYADFLRGQREGRLLWEEEGTRTEVRYVEAAEAAVRVELPEDCRSCRVSGDNQGGLLLTMRRGV